MPEVPPELLHKVPAGFNIAEDLKALVARVADAVVTMRAQLKREGREGEGTGSGFAVAATPFVVTNRHVIEHASAVTVVTRDRRAVRARVRGAGAGVDLAVLEPRGAVGAGVPLGDSDTVAPGEFIVVIGNPLGEFENSVTVGVISGVRRFDDGQTYLQLDAAVSPGNSGGPVFNVHAQVIGVVVAQIAAERAQNLNLAIPSNEARALLR